MTLIPPIGAGTSGNTSTRKTSTTATRKKSGSNSLTLYKQPLFDKRIRTLSWPMQGGVGSTAKSDFGGMEILRGVMVWDRTFAPYTSKAEVNFLFNPTEITTSYDMDAEDVASTLMFRSPVDSAQAAFAMNQSVNFSLYFDRTFELWGAYNEQTGLPNAPTKATASSGNTTAFGYDVTDPTVYGVNVDILAFKQFTGQLLNQYSINGNVNTGNPNPSAGGYMPGISQQGVFTMIPSWVFFGPDTGVVYYGYISDFTVTITHWTKYMIPMRAIIDVDFALMMPPASEPDGPSFTDWMVLTELNQDAAALSGNQSASGKAGR